MRIFIQVVLQALIVQIRAGSVDNPTLTAIQKLRNNQYKQSIVNLEKSKLYSLTVINDIAYAAGTGAKIYEVDLATRKFKTYDSGHASDIRCLHATDDLLVSGHNDGVVQIRYRGSMQVIAQLADHWGKVRACRIDGNILVTGSLDRTAIVYDISELHVENGPWRLMTLHGHTKTVRALDINEDYIVTASYDHSLKIWSRRSGALVRTLRGHSRAVRSVKFFDHETIISVSEDKTMRVWNVHKDAPLRTNYNACAGYVAVSNKLVFTTQSKSSCLKLNAWNFNKLPVSIPTSPSKVMKLMHDRYIQCIEATNSRIVTVDWNGGVNILEIYN